MPKLSIAETDTKVEEEGRWAPHPDGFEFRIARMGNPRYQAARRAALEPFKERFRAGGDLTQEESDEVLRPLLARYILTGWRKVENETDGQSTPDTYENRLKLFCNPALRRVAEWIVLESQNDEEYLRRNLEAAAKN